MIFSEKVNELTQKPDFKVNVYVPQFFRNLEKLLKETDQKYFTKVYILSIL